MNEKSCAGYTEEEIIKALQVIKNICTEQGVCNEKCPFVKPGISQYADCNIGLEIPQDWDLNVPSWKAFK